MSDQKNGNNPSDDLDYDMVRDDENYFAAEDDDAPAAPTSTIADIDDYEEYEDTAAGADAGDDSGDDSGDDYDDISDLTDNGDDEDAIVPNKANRPPKASSGNKRTTLLFAGVAAFILVGVGGYFALSGGSSAPAPEAMPDVVPVAAAPDMAAPAPIDPNAVPPVADGAMPAEGTMPADGMMPPADGAMPADGTMPPVATNPNDPMGVGGAPPVEASGTLPVDPNAPSGAAPVAGTAAMGEKGAEPITDITQLPAPTPPSNDALPDAAMAEADAAKPVIADAAVPNPGEPAVLEEVPSTDLKAAGQKSDQTGVVLPELPEGADDAVDAAAKAGAAKVKGDEFYDTGDVVNQLADMADNSAGPGLPAASEYVVVTKGSRGSTSTSTLTTLAQKALDAGRHQAAVDLFGDALMRNSSDRSALLGRAIANQKLGNTDAAIRDYERLLTVAPGNKEAVINLAGLIRQRDPAVARSRLSSLQEEYPDNAGIAAQKAMMAADQGDYNAAAAQLEKAITLEPNNPMHYFNRAIAAEQLGNKRQAIEFYERALDIDSIHASGRGLPRDKVYDRLTILRQ